MHEVSRFKDSSAAAGRATRLKLSHANRVRAGAAQTAARRMKPRQAKSHLKSGRRARRTRYYVDRAMCGGEMFLEEFDLIEFCQVLQRLVPKLEIVPVTDPAQRAQNSHPELVDARAFDTAIGQYVHT